MKVTGIELNKTKLSMQIGDETNLIATIRPTNATNKSVIWSSSNEKVATITKEGIIKAISKGTTEIIVTSAEGEFTAKCNLTVIEKTNTDDDIYKGQTTNDNKKDETIAQTILPAAGSKLTITVMTIVFTTVIIILVKYKKYEDIK